MPYEQGAFLDEVCGGSSGSGDGSGSGGDAGSREVEDGWQEQEKQQHSWQQVGSASPATIADHAASTEPSGQPVAAGGWRGSTQQSSHGALALTNKARLLQRIDDSAMQLYGSMGVYVHMPGLQATDSSQAQGLPVLARDQCMPK